MQVKASKTLSIKHATILFAYLLIVWGFYRLLFQFPEPFEEVLVKPLVWLLPVAYFLRKERDSIRSIGITLENIFPTIYFSLALGIVFALEGVLINYVKYGELSFGANIGRSGFAVALLLSFITAVSEELAFRGYLFTRLWKGLSGEWRANLVTSCAWVLIHFPIAFFDWRLAPVALVTYLALVFIFAVGSAFLFARTKNIFSSVLLHVLWQWPIILFR